MRFMNTVSGLATIGTVVAALSFSTAVMADDATTGNWNCANDKAKSVPQSMPGNAVATGTAGFAPKGSRFDVGLIKGGPRGYFAFGHLHAIHNARNGGSDYAVTAFLADESGYYYAGLPMLTTRVNGVSDKPDRHRHCGGQFRLSDQALQDIQDAVEGGVPLHWEILSERKRKSDLGAVLDELKGPLKEYFLGQMDMKSALDKLNVGKSPSKK